jgi:hypothetical protein
VSDFGDRFGALAPVVQPDHLRARVLAGGQLRGGGGGVDDHGAVRFGVDDADVASAEQAFDRRDAVGVG